LHAQNKKRLNMIKKREISDALKKFKKKRYLIVIAVVVILAIVGVSVFGEKLFQKEFWQEVISKVDLSNHEPKQPQCTIDTTLSCSNGEIIVTQECNNGILVNTGKICPCIANTTISCEGGSAIITQLCENGVLSNTGKVCPCIRNMTITCEDGSVLVTQDCINGRLINTGKICPCFSDNIQICYDGSKETIQNCVNGKLVNTGNVCPTPVYVPIVIALNTQSLQTLFQKCEYFTKLPGNAAILLTFFDGNGAMRSEKFFISGGGVLSTFSEQKYDLEFTLGDYRVPELESSSDFCDTLRKTKEQQDLRVSLKNVFSSGKYFYLKNCVPF